MIILLTFPIMMLYHLYVIINIKRLPYLVSAPRNANLWACAQPPTEVHVQPASQRQAAIFNFSSSSALFLLVPSFLKSRNEKDREICDKDSLLSSSSLFLLLRVKQDFSVSRQRENRKREGDAVERGVGSGRVGRSWFSCQGTITGSLRMRLVELNVYHLLGSMAACWTIIGAISFVQA